MENIRVFILEQIDERENDVTELIVNETTKIKLKIFRDKFVSIIALLKLEV